MASKRRNMFQKNKTQETTENDSGAGNENCWTGYTSSCGGAYTPSVGYGMTPVDCLPNDNSPYQTASDKRCFIPAALLVFFLISTPVLRKSSFQPPDESSHEAFLDNTDYSGYKATGNTGVSGNGELVEDCHAAGASYDPAGCWSSPTNYNNYYSGSSQVPPPPPPPPPPTNPQHYSTPPMVLYPSVYSTVNQNQIHLHVHNVSSSEYKPSDLYAADDVTAIVGSNNVTISSGGNRGGGIEIGIVQDQTPQQDQMHRYDQRHADPSVWRPY
ncbi:hypothetical protein AAG570_003430 [Ranatra chinensis]|uniref:Uncharacterized protein n=1 Tax=Ranatra chinensis TaxID=642074 RepID=A0ABD0YS75_9HEMI